MSQLTVFTALKNADLTAISAQEALKNLLNIRFIRSLRRFTKWALYSENEVSEKGFEEAIESLTKNSILLCNPNKEFLYFNTIPDSKNTKDCHVFNLEIYPIKETDHSDIIQKLNDKSNIPITKIKQHTYWELVVESNKPIKDLMKDIENQIVISTSISQGLLLNPLYENYSLTHQR